MSTRKSVKNYANLYKSAAQFLDPEYIVYHHHPEISTLFFNVNASKLLYTRKSKSELYEGELIFHYRIYQGEESKEIIDSGSFLFTDRVVNKASKDITGQIEFDYQIGDKGLLIVYCTDNNRNFTIEKHIYLDKKNKGDEQFFLVRDTEGNPYLKKYVSETRSVVIESSLNKEMPVYIRHYIKEFPISAPPFSVTINKPFSYTADNLYSFVFDAEGLLNYTIPDTGFVQFQIDTTTQIGYSIFNFEDFFPYVQTAKLMMNPTRYISTSKEYDELINSESPKLSIDDFWMSKAGSKERAREVIRKYYNRVENANTHFTSYIEGWKTDRGMISIVFGDPGIVNKTIGKEVWTYGDENNMNSFSFVFHKVENPFSDNDYKLQRGIFYKLNWYKAVDAWRSGFAFWIQ